MAKQTPGMRWIIRAALVVIVAAGWCGAAPAFYFRNWPGDGRPRQEVIIRPDAESDSNPPSGRNPDLTPGEDVTPPPGGDTKNPPTVKNPPGVPEPGTLALVVAGIGALVAGRRLRKKSD